MTGRRHAATSNGLGPLALALALASTAGAARADEPLFGYVNTTDLLPKGRSQVEQWITFREGRDAGRFRLIEGRGEAEYGLADNVQLTAYLNYSDLHADLSEARAQSAGLPPGVRLAPVGSMSRERFDSVTGEVIWRLTSPYLSAIGLALLVDGTVGRGRQRSLGVKAIAQKNFRDDTVVLAANARVDLGLRETAPTLGPGPSSRRAVTPVELDLGASYRFRPNWSAALELRARNKYSGDLLGAGRREDAAVFFGPTLHYGGQRWFFTLTALQRLHASHRAPAPGQILDGLVYAGERARWDGVRFRVGRTF